MPPLPIGNSAGHNDADYDQQVRDAIVSRLKRKPPPNMTVKSQRDDNDSEEPS